MGDIGEHGFDHGHTMAVDLLSLVAINSRLHPVGVAEAVLILFYNE